MPARITYLSFKKITKLYFDDHLTFEQIGKRFGVSRQTIINRFKKRGLQTRTRGTMRIGIPREIVQELYVNQRLSMLEVAERTNSTPWKVRNALRRYGIETRQRGGRIKYPELSRLKIGESITVPRPKAKGKWQGVFYDMAKTHGIKLSVRTAENGMVRLICVA